MNVNQLVDFQSWLQKEIEKYHLLSDACSIENNREYFLGKAIGLEHASFELKLRIAEVS